MPERIDRRTFLTMAGIGGIAGAVGFNPLTNATAGRGLGGRARAAGRAAAWDRSNASVASLEHRVLVVLEMAGGNDGLSMAPPSDAGALVALRPEAFPDESALLRVGNDVVLHPAFERLQHRRLALVDGIGSAAPDLSHFEMLRRWWTGDPEGTARQTTGFLGRLCDHLDVGAPATGVSIGSASSPALVAERAGTLGLPDPGWLWWMNGADSEVDEWTAAYRAGLRAMADPDAADGATVAAARRALDGGLGVGEMIGAFGEVEGYPSSNLGGKLALASQLIAADVGVRVLHVSMDGDFDTHESHLDRHSSLMAELDEALDAFLDDLDGRGDGDRVVVATISEFGRRPEQNGSRGLDHGTASVGLLAGPVNAGRYGEPLDLAARDADDNFVATTSMTDYYATLAERWFEVPASDLLDGDPSPIDGIW